MFSVYTNNIAIKDLWLSCFTKLFYRTQTFSGDISPLAVNFTACKSRRKPSEYLRTMHEDIDKIIRLTRSLFLVIS